MRFDVADTGTMAGSVPAGPEMRQLHHLYTPEQVAFVLQRERARADRHRREFSLVMFRTESDLRTDLALTQMAKIVLAHARATDEVGNYDKDSVCVILPDTDATGAWKFAQRACDSAKRQDLMPICVVYTYPNAWFPKEKKHYDHHNGNGTHGHKTLGQARTDDRRRLPELNAAVHLAEVTPTEIPIQPLEPLLAHPMPWWKRTIDLIGAGMALLAFSPIMVVIAAAIKLTSSGPVFFIQKRAGLGGKSFGIYKFRSMAVDAEARKKELMKLNEQDGPAFKIKADPRVTRIGKFIRMTSLDELPQLWNVVRGEMSLVGPRPLPMDEAGAADQWQQRRLSVTPGLTCIWQVKGRSRVTFDEWVRMDINYIRRRNIGHDISILLQTIPAVLLRRGAR